MIRKFLNATVVALLTLCLSAPGQAQFDTIARGLALQAIKGNTQSSATAAAASATAAAASATSAAANQALLSGAAPLAPLGSSFAGLYGRTSTAFTANAVAGPITATSDVMSLTNPALAVSFSALMAGSTTGRKIKFWVYDSTGAVTWVGTPIDASAAGIVTSTYSLSTAPTIPAGGGFGATSDTDAGGSGKGIAIGTNAGTAIPGNTARMHSSFYAEPTVGMNVKTVATWTERDDYQPVIQAKVVDARALLTLGYINQPYGVPALDANGQVPQASVSGLTQSMSSLTSALAGVGQAPPAQRTTTLGAVSPVVGVATIALRKVVIANDPNLTFTGDRIVRKFASSFTTALAGRTIEFYLLNSAGTVKFASGLQAAPNAGEIDYTLPDSSLIANAGDYPAVWSSAAAGTDGIVARDNQGNGAIGQVLLNSVSGQLVLGSTYTSATSGYTSATRYLPSIAITHSPKAALVATDWANLPNGPLFLDATGQLPAGLNPTNTPLGSALTTYPTPVAASGSQSGRIVLGIGNSIQAGGDNKNSAGVLDHNGYRQQLATYFGWNYHDLAVAGSSMRAWGIDQNSVRTNSLAIANVSLILIGYTENDSPIPLGVITDLYPTQDTIYGNLNKMVADMKAAWPSATIVFESATSPWPTYLDTTHGTAQWLKFWQIDDAKRQVAIAQGIQFLSFRDDLPKPPLWQNFLDPGYDATSGAFLGYLHPTSLGHTYLFNIAVQYYGQISAVELRDLPKVPGNDNDTAERMAA